MNKLLIFCCCCLPLRHMQLTSGYGYRIHPITGKYSFHSGIDINARSDTVFAILPGRFQASYNNLLGIFIRIDHGDFQSIYGHLSQFFVMTGDTVSAGDPLGITGTTGRVTGEHLHFSVQYHHAYVNPLKFLLLLTNQIHHK